MLLLVVLYIYIIYRWTRRVAARTELRSSKGRFVGLVCLKMAWRLVIMCYVLMIAWAAASAVTAMPGQVGAASSQGTSTGMAVAILTLPINFLIAIIVSLNSFRDRYSASRSVTPELTAQKSHATPQQTAPSTINLPVKPHRSIGILILAGLLTFILGAVAAIVFVRANSRPMQTATAPTHSSPVASSAQVARGHDLQYSIELPSSWTITKGGPQFDLFATSKSLYVGVVAEAANVGSPNVIADVARKSLSSEARDVDATEPVDITIDGRQWLGFTARCHVDRIPVAYQFYVYAGPEGTFQLVGWTTQNLFDHEVESLRAVMRTFKFPVRVIQSLTPIAAPQSFDPSHWKKITGRQLAYSIRIPPTWERKRDAEDFDVTVGREAIRVGIIAEAADLGDSDVVADIAQKRISEGATEVSAGRPLPITIDGREWLQFRVDCKVHGVPAAYQFYVYAGREGTFQIVGWTVQNLFQPDAAEMRSVMQTFTFASK